MDIVVTIPKIEYKNNIKEREYQKQNPDSYGFRVFNKLPNKANIGDRIYFIRDNIVFYSKEIIKIDNNSTNMKCDVTNRNYSGNYKLCFKNERDERHLNIKCKGFQGFRYKWWED